MKPAGLSIRVRLSLWYSAVLLAGLLAFAFLLWFAVRASLFRSLDDALEQRVRGAIAVLEEEGRATSPLPSIREELGEYADSVPEGRLLEVRGPDGQLIFPQDPLPPLKRHAYRVLLRTDFVQGRRYEVRAAASLEGIRRLLDSFRWLLLWSIPATLLLASVGGYFISRRALQPVDDITRSARSIGIGNLSSRLPSTGAHDELARLASAWNEMLARLEAAVNRLTQFTADASHELRTPVALIRTTAELALRRERSNDEYREALRQIVHESERETKLIEDLLTLARADASGSAFPLEPLDLVPLVREVCAQARLLAEAAGLRMEVSLPANPAPIRGNGAALRRLVLILLDNAIKYTASGGAVTLSLSAGPAPTLAVRDTGVGIAPEVHPHIFERFYRADPSRNREAGGSGLGLAIAKWIADRHHASIDAMSVTGQGSEFTVRFPAAL